MKTKIKKLLADHKLGSVCLASWLGGQGISRSLQESYQHYGWLESIGPGAYKRPGEDLTWRGALYALQVQANLPVHPGAMTALAMQGFAHYLRLGQETVFLFSPPRTTLPAWFRKHDWRTRIQHVRTSMLPPALGLQDYDDKNFTVRIASPERAILECLYLAPDELDLLECAQLMEGLVNLRPKLVQSLLVACTSIKVKRLFLFLADKQRHAWFSRVDATKLDLGRGDRSLAKGGVYVAKYRLVLPESLVAQ